ncbi:MAG: hypothetical protein ACI9VM_000036 [Candidatus Azotimanducaceae bacterium]|jgi:hypothetical protein
MKKVRNLLRSMFPDLYSLLYRVLKGPRRYKNLFKSITHLRAQKILEVGVWNGKRAVEMIDRAKKYNSDISYYGFDLFEELTEEKHKEELSKWPPSKSEVESLLQKTGADISLFTGNTLQSLPAAISSLPKMDFIFIDGGHSNETVLSDWENVRTLMHKDTIVIFDDYWRNRVDGGSKLTVDAIDTEYYNLEILPEIDSFNNPDFGRLDISFAKVTLRN